MDPALRKLLKLRLRAWLRRIRPALKTPRGAIFFAIGVIMLLMWVGPSVAMGFVAVGHVDTQVTRTMIPLALMGMCVLAVFTSGRQKGIPFSAAEIDFLFAGPFTRRELLLYKLSSSLAGALFFSLCVSLVFLRYASFWIAAFVGCLLALAFVQLFSTALVLIAQTVAEHAYTRARKLVLLAVAALAGIGLAEAGRAATEGGVLALARAFQQSWAGTILLAPVDVFGRTILARTLFPELAGWGALALAVNLALLTLVLRLDVNYMEAAIATSRKLYRRLQQVRRGGGLDWTAGSTGRVHLPLLPRLGGAGPIVRRQLIRAVRASRGLVFFVVVTAIPIGTIMFASGGEHAPPMAALAGPLAFMTVFFTQMVPFDFRGDLDHMELLKALPLGSTAVAAGQIAVPTLLMTMIHLAVLAVAAGFLAGSPLVLALIAAFAIPFNLLLVGVENLLFLTFPARMAPTSPGDLQHVGRMMVLLAVKMLALGACCGLAAGLGGVAYLVSARSWIAAACTAWLALAVFAVMLVPCVAWAYRKFDISVDTPP